MLWLQQYLPFTVLKLKGPLRLTSGSTELLQQYLPFTVLKPKWQKNSRAEYRKLVATVLTVYGIETI